MNQSLIISARQKGGIPMRTKLAAAALCAVLIVGAGIAAYSAEKSTTDNLDFGKREYESNCAVCHGRSGKGDGPYAAVLATKIADLTTLSKRNNGVFPLARVQEFIDGRETVKAHGPRDMPIWGRDYLWEGAYTGSPNPEAYMRVRILSLTDYIYRLQAK
jgi:mono/diheme cytochrome c family protein